MSATLDQTEYEVHESALANMGFPARTPQSTINTAIDANVQQPLRLVQTLPTADALLNIKSNRVKVGDGTGRSSAPSGNTIPVYPDTTINFQTGVVTGGTVKKDAGVFSLPGGSTIGYFRRVYFVYSPEGNWVDCTFSSEVADINNLPDPGILQSLLTGQDMGWMDIEATAASAYKTAGSATAVIENQVGGVARIIAFGSGAGGGAGGDTSFKFQSISGSVLTVKKGYLALWTGEELYASSDITIDLSTKTTGDGNWYGYIDYNSLPAYTTVNGRRLIAVSSSNFIFSTTTPDAMDLQRYIPRGVIVRSGGGSPVYANAQTYAYLNPQAPIGMDRIPEYTLSLQAIGTVGNAGQIAAGHQLATASFPSAAIGANLSWYNLPDMNDDSGNARTLTNNNAATFGTGILGDSNQAVSMNGTNQFLSSSDSLFNPGDNDFTCGAWFYRSNWTTGFVGLIAQWQSLKQSFLVNTGGPGVILINSSVDGTNVTYSSAALPITTGWAHICLKYEAATNKFTLYFNGKNILTHVAAGNLYSVTGPVFWLGQTQSSQYFDGKIDEFFFGRYAMSDNDIAKIYSSKLTHSRTLSPVSQHWMFSAISADGQARELFDNVVDMDVDDLYFDLSDEISTAQVELKLYNKSGTGLAKASKARTLEMTTDALDALLPITHSLGVVPEISLKVKNVSNDYEYHDAGTYFVATATQIKATATTLVAGIGTGVTVVLTFATANMASFVPNRFWNNRTATSAISLSVNDRVMADTQTIAAFTGTLPLSPSIGDEIQVCDSKGYFGTNNFTFGRNGQNIMGSASDFVANISHKMYRAVYVDATYGWAIYF